jgi:prepilin-type processing-associated H-X9-DG protein
MMNGSDSEKIIPEQTEKKPTGKWAKLVFGLMLFSLATLIAAEYLAVHSRPMVPLHQPPNPVTFPSILMSLSILAALLSLILGVVVGIKERKKQKSLGGKLLIGSGRVISLFLLLILPFTKEIPCIRIVHDQAICLRQVRDLSLALLMYSDENNETFPPADHWCDAILPFVKDHDKKIFVCPDAQNQTCSYALNKNIAGKPLADIDQPADCIAVFESDMGWNKAGDASDLPKPARHNTGNNYGYADGHAKWAKAEYMTEFWKPHREINPEVQE